MCLLLAAVTLKDDMVRYAEHRIIRYDTLINVSFAYSTFSQSKSKGKNGTKIFYPIWYYINAAIWFCIDDLSLYF